MTHRSPRTIARRPAQWPLLWIGALVTLGCAISPKPEPPEASLNLGGIRADTQVYGELDLVGAPGAAQPSGALLRAYPLGHPDPRVETKVMPDGSFLLPQVASAGEEVRLELISDTEHMAPLDLVVGEKGSPCVAAPRPLASCLQLVPAKEIELASGQKSITVRSTCATEVTLIAPAARRELPELVLGANLTWPATLQNGEELTIDVQLTSQASFDEEIIFIEATTPERDRRPITVRTRP